MPVKKQTQVKSRPQGDFFTACLSDLSPIDDIENEEQPLFALKSGDKRVRRYEHNGQALVIKPGYDGMATIHDKDLWVYCISQLVAAQNEGLKISRTLRFTAHDFLVTTSRSVGGPRLQTDGRCVRSTLWHSVGNHNQDGRQTRDTWVWVD